MRTTSSATQTGFSPASHSTVASIAARSPPAASSTPRDTETPANRAPGRHGCGKPNSVDPVVDDHPVDRGQQLVQHRHAEREGEEAVRDRRAEGARGRSLAVDMDPLRVVGRRREGVDSFLRYLEPGTRPQLDADELPERSNGAPTGMRVTGAESDHTGRTRWTAAPAALGGLTHAAAAAVRIRVSDSSRPSSSRLS